jgi:hypothetical protein
MLTQLSEEKVGSMRSGGRSFALLVLMVALAGAVRDVPEILSLADDYSNDGVPVSSERLVSRVTSRRVARQERLRAAASRSLAPGNLRVHFTLVPSFVLLTAAGQGRLHFLALLRD